MSDIELAYLLAATVASIILFIFFLVERPSLSPVSIGTKCILAFIVPFIFPFWAKLFITGIKWAIAT